MSNGVTSAEVRLWDTLIGIVSWNERTNYASFEYMPNFISSGIEVAPIHMKLSPEIYSFPNLSPKSFYGLPGMLADSLPDKFGNRIIQTWLAQQGKNLRDLNPIERLCLTGKRGMGALEYFPAIDQDIAKDQKLEIDQLVQVANLILAQRTELNETLENKKSVLGILYVGSSAGGARAKAVIAWNPKTNEVRSGQIDVPSEFEHWLIKFDGISRNQDKEAVCDDPQGYGLVEYAYHQMAIDCGIEMSPARLFSENGRHHFMTKRFDRLPSGQKLHMQSLAALGHYDFNDAGSHSYEQVFSVIRQLELPFESYLEFFRRMVFNIVARNQDDHVKNIAFLMDKQGNWKLSPAFDLTYNYQEDGVWTSVHQMTLNGKRNLFSLDDFIHCANTVNIKKNKAIGIINKIQSVVSKWPAYAEQVGVYPERRDKIAKNLRLEPFT